VSLWDALSDERLGLSFARQSAVFTRVSVHSQVLTFQMFDIQIRVHTVYVGPLSVRAQYNNLCPTDSSSGYNGSLDSCTVVHVTATKFKPPIFSVWGFTLSNIAYIFIIMNDFWLSSAHFCN
jgi:hypothetical protein